MTTLALNIIVGANETSELKRCLDSFNVRENFDEIVIGLTSKDENVKKVAKNFADVLVDIQWSSERYPNGNFSIARNKLIDNTKSDMIMWLDSDDCCLGIHQGKFRKLCGIVRNNTNSGIDAYFVPYAVSLDSTLEPLSVFMRERVFKNNGVLRWKNPVHEQFDVHWDDLVAASFKNFFITHLPSKPQYASALRNVKILEHEYEKFNGNMDTQLKYFLSRDLLLSGDQKRALSIFGDMIQNLEGSYENLYLACIEIAFFYAYNNYLLRPKIDDMDINNLDKVEHWSRLALGFSMDYAEPYVLLGDIYLQRELREQAENMYIVALKKKLYSGMMQTTAFYEELPAERLSNLYMAKGENEKALWYARRAWEHNKMNQNRIEQRKILIGLLAKEVNECQIQ
jgi:glycosyltransferase involved in cell wall biosynthesis